MKDIPALRSSAMDREYDGTPWRAAIRNSVETSEDVLPANPGDQTSLRAPSLRVSDR